MKHHIDQISLLINLKLLVFNVSLLAYICRWDAFNNYNLYCKLRPSDVTKVFVWYYMLLSRVSIHWVSQDFVWYFDMSTCLEYLRTTPPHVIIKQSSFSFMEWVTLNTKCFIYISRQLEIQFYATIRLWMSEDYIYNYWEWIVQNVVCKHMYKFTNYRSTTKATAFNKLLYRE